MAIGTELPRQDDSTGLTLTCMRHQAIEPIGAEWDRLVPRDLPHLRAGFLKAVQQSGMVQDPLYLTVHHEGRPVAVALAYTLYLDSAQSAPPGRRQWIAWIRRRFPQFMRRPLRICGSPVGNAESGVSFDPQLPPELRRPVFRRIAEEVLSASRISEAVFFKEFTEDAVAAYASELEPMGFFTVDPGPGTRLDLPWSTFEDYLAAMHKRYRARVRKDLKASEDLAFCLLDSFADLAPVAVRLYDNVISHAEFTLQTATAPFFSAVSEFEQAQLLVARTRETGEVVGINLLLFGDTCMHNVYIGYDEERNEQFHTYFSLVEHSIRLAIERKCRVCYLGQASYEFKARLGAVPFALAAFMKHRIWPVHWLLRSARDKFFPKSEIATHDVFHAEPAA